MRFSERLGYKPTRLPLDIKEIPDSLQNALWDVCLDHLIFPYKEENYDYVWIYTDRFNLLTQRLWAELLKKPRDTIPNRPDDGFEKVRETFHNASFPDLYDIVELFSDVAGKYQQEIQFSEACNEVFTREKAALRFVSGKLTPIIDETEVTEVKNCGVKLAIACEGTFCAG